MAHNLQTYCNFVCKFHRHGCMQEKILRLQRSIYNKEKQMSTQLIFTLLILVAAIGYGGYRVYIVLKEAGNPCRNCPGCTLRNSLKGKHINARKRREILSSCEKQIKNIEK